MPIRIWNRPKIEFDIHGIEASCMGFSFIDCESDIEIRSGQVIRIHVPVKCNQTFEQAVIAWVESYVKENFEPIVLPKQIIDTKVPQHDGFNIAIDRIFNTNPTIIIEEAE